MAGTSAAERKRKSRARRTEEQKLLEREKAKEFMKNLRMKMKNDTQWKRKRSIQVKNAENAPETKTRIVYNCIFREF